MGSFLISKVLLVLTTYIGVGECSWVGCFMGQLIYKPVINVGQKTIQWLDTQNKQFSIFTLEDCFTRCSGRPFVGITYPGLTRYKNNPRIFCACGDQAPPVRELRAVNDCPMYSQSTTSWSIINTTEEVTAVYENMNRLCVRGTQGRPRGEKFQLIRTIEIHSHFWHRSDFDYNACSDLCLKACKTVVGISYRREITASEGGFLQCSCSDSMPKHEYDIVLPSSACPTLEQWNGDDYPLYESDYDYDYYQYVGSGTFDNDRIDTRVDIERVDHDSDIKRKLYWSARVGTSHAYSEDLTVMFNVDLNTYKDCHSTPSVSTPATLTSSHDITFRINIHGSTPGIDGNKSDRNSSTSSKDRNKAPVGAKMTGGVIGGVVVILLITGIVCFMIYLRRKRGKNGDLEHREIVYYNTQASGDLPAAPVPPASAISDHRHNHHDNHEEPRYITHEDAAENEYADPDVTIPVIYAQPRRNREFTTNDEDVTVVDNVIYEEGQGEINSIKAPGVEEGQPIYAKPRKGNNQDKAGACPENPYGDDFEEVSDWVNQGK